MCICALCSSRTCCWLFHLILHVNTISCSWGCSIWLSFLPGCTRRLWVTV